MYCNNTVLYVSHIRLMYHKVIIKVSLSILKEKNPFNNLLNFVMCLEAFSINLTKDKSLCYAEQ